MKRCTFFIFFIIPILLIPQSFEKTYSFGVDYGNFSIPDSLLEQALLQYSSIKGRGITFKFRNYGVEGIESVYASEFSLKIYSISTGGLFQVYDDDYVYGIDGRLNVFSITYTKIVRIIPSFPVTPYVGIGIGAGMAKLDAHYTKYGKNGEENEPYKYETLIPIVRIPAGISVTLKDLQLEIEAGIENGLYISFGALYLFH